MRTGRERKNKNKNKTKQNETNQRSAKIMIIVRKKAKNMRKEGKSAFIHSVPASAIPDGLLGSPKGSVVFCEMYTVAEPQLIGHISCSSTLKSAACGVERVRDRTHPIPSGRQDNTSQVFAVRPSRTTRRQCFADQPMNRHRYLLLVFVQADDYFVQAG